MFSLKFVAFMHKDCISIRICSNSSKKKKKQKPKKPGSMCRPRAVWGGYGSRREAQLRGAAVVKPLLEGGLVGQWWTGSWMRLLGSLLPLAVFLLLEPLSITFLKFNKEDGSRTLMGWSNALYAASKKKIFENFFCFFYVHITINWVLIDLNSFFSLKLVLLKLVKFDST